MAHNHNGLYNLNISYYFRDHSFPNLELQINELSNEEKKQYVVYDFNSFIAEVGGFMGLLLGYSILSLYDEVADLLRRFNIKRMTGERGEAFWKLVFERLIANRGKGGNQDETEGGNQGEVEGRNQDQAEGGNQDGFPIEAFWDYVRVI